MELTFKTRALREACEDRDEAKAQFGELIAGELVRRLADLRAAGSVADLVAGSPRVTDGHLLIKLGEDHLLDCVPGHVRAPLNESGDVEWKRVTRLQIARVTDNAGV